MRTGTWQHAGKYVSALVGELPRRNGWTIAQHAADCTPICAVTAALLKDRTGTQAPPPVTPASHHAGSTSARG